MPHWLQWLVLGLAAWVVLSVPLALAVGRFLSLSGRSWPAQAPAAPARETRAPRRAEDDHRRRILLVEDDYGFSVLVASTLPAGEFEVLATATAAQARTIVPVWRPDVVLLDVGLPDADGLELCAELTAGPAPPVVILLTGAEVGEAEAADAGASAALRKPFSPLELLGLIDRLAGQPAERPWVGEERGEDQLRVYARDLSRVIAIEREQRTLVEHAYRETVSALAAALEARDTGTPLHGVRVARYALELAQAVDPDLAADPSLVYGFLLHDVGKLAVPDRILLKDGPLDPVEFAIVQKHPVIGEQLLSDVALLQGAGLGVVRSHHERWDGAGYPDGLAGAAIPLGARIFAVADTLDAMTSDRPYRQAGSWTAAVEEIGAQAGRQFDPRVCEVFHEIRDRLRADFAEFGRRAERGARAGAAAASPSPARV